MVKVKAEADQECNTTMVKSIKSATTLPWRGEPTMHVTIRFAVDNAPFWNDETEWVDHTEIAHTLRKLATKVEEDSIDFIVVRDVNGQTIGEYRIVEEEEQ